MVHIQSDEVAVRSGGMILTEFWKCFDGRASVCDVDAGIGDVSDTIMQDLELSLRPFVCGRPYFTHRRLTQHIDIDLCWLHGAKAQAVRRVTPAFGN